MSLIVAKQVGNNILVVSDTKLSDSRLEKKYIVSNDNPKDGVLKAVIISEKICVCFAGKREDARDAYKKINPKQTVSEILETLLYYNRLFSGSTDFILCSNIDVPCIYEIKNGNIIPTSNAWIGDHNAFEKFQNYFHRGNNNDISANSISLISGHVEDPFSKALNAMDCVIKDDAIHTVGGYRVSLSIRDSKFQYDFYMDTHFAPKTITLKAGEFFPLGHDTAASGGYTLTFIGASQDYKYVAFHIKQGNVGVLYAEKDGLLEPQLISMDEVDFHDYLIRVCNITPMFSTENRFDNFKKKALNAYFNNDFKTAISLFDKAIFESTGANKIEVLFFKGASLHFLKRAEEAIKVFQEVIRLDISYQPKIFQIMQRGMR